MCTVYSSSARANISLFFWQINVEVDEVVNVLQEKPHHDIVERDANLAKVPELVNKVAAEAVKTVTEAAQSM